MKLWHLHGFHVEVDKLRFFGMLVSRRSAFFFFFFFGSRWSDVELA